MSYLMKLPTGAHGNVQKGFMIDASRLYSSLDITSTRSRTPNITVVCLISNNIVLILEIYDINLIRTKSLCNHMNTIRFVLRDAGYRYN